MCDPSSRLSHEQILRALQDPANRMMDTPEDRTLASVYMHDPTPEHAAMVCARLETKATQHAGLREDPFRANYPPANTPLVGGASLWMGAMPTGEGLPRPLAAVSKGVVCIGPPGTGKTTWNQQFVTQATLSREKHNLPISVIIFDEKKTYRHLADWPGVSDSLIRLTIDDIPIALGQPPPGVDADTWHNELVEVFASSFRSLSAPRLLRKIVAELASAKGSGEWFSLAALVAAIEHYRPQPGAREAQYKDALLGSLTSLRAGTRMFDHVRSNALECLLTVPRTVILENEHLGPDELCFAISLMARWVYQWRRAHPEGRNMLLVFVIEDATPIVSAKRSEMSPGGQSPIDRLAVVTREMGVGLFIVAHQFGDLSPALLANCETLVAFSPRRDNDRHLMQMMGTSPQQTTAMKEFGRGVAVVSAPSVWPKPVPVRFPPRPGEALP